VFAGNVVGREAEVEGERMNEWMNDVNPVVGIFCLQAYIQPPGRSDNTHGDDPITHRLFSRKRRWWAQGST
jgi:hypothetical protein